MANSVTTAASEKMKYSKFLSSLFCSASIIGLSLLCLLNNLSFDIYSACMLLRVVIPASFCFWFIGFSMGHILDYSHSENAVIGQAKLTEDEAAYQIPSLFSGEDIEMENGDLEGL